MHLRTFVPHVFWLALGGCIEQAAVDEGAQDQQIVGGTPTEISTAPWQVSLQTTQGAHFCGGSILTPTWIATASHCLAGSDPTQMRVVAGISRVSQSATGQIRLVKRALISPGYTDASAGKDAALLELTTPLTLNGATVAAIRPVTSRTPASLTNPGVNATVTGWGLLTEGATTLPDQLNTVTVPIVSLADASTDYGMTLSTDQLAAGLRGTGGRDSCQGDSGGPLVVSNGTEKVLAGIVSWGEGCARPTAPGMYARVASFSKWMDSYVGGPPQAGAGADLVTAPGARVTLDASASKDAGFGTITTYSWRQVSGASQVTIESGSQMTASFVAPSSTGDLEFELTVTDEQGATATDRLLVTVGNQPGNGGNSVGNGDDGSADITGGCSAGGSSGLGFAMLALLGALPRRRRR